MISRLLYLSSFLSFTNAGVERRKRHNKLLSTTSSDSCLLVGEGDPRKVFQSSKIPAKSVLRSKHGVRVTTLI